MATSAPLRIWRRSEGPDALGDAVLQGGLVLIEADAPCAATATAMVQRARDIVTACFGSDPERAEVRLAPDAFRRAAVAARRAVRNDSEIDRLWLATLSALGYAPDTIHRDCMRLRVVPSTAAACGRFIRPLPAHRDSWGSRCSAQINWWTPLYPVAPERTLLIWPDAFARPVANNCADWDYEALLRGEDRQAPILPVATEAPPGAPVAVRISPGDLLAFSAAHLHASATDDSGITRFGLDTRKVWTGDLAAARSAPNVDGPGGPPRWEMFDRAPSATACARAGSTTSVTNAAT